MALVEAGRYYTAIEADIARSALAAAGIEGVVFDTQMSAYTAGGLIPVRLMVIHEDLGEAQAVLAARA